MLQLEIFRDRQLVATVPISRDELVIGRDPHCDVVLNDPAVSRRHARLQVSASGEFLIEDLSRGNGILLGDRKVERTVLRHSTTVQMGRTYLRLCLGGIGLHPPASTAPGDFPPPLDAPTEVITAVSPSWSAREPCVSWSDRDGPRQVSLTRPRLTLGPGRDADVVLRWCGCPSSPLAAFVLEEGDFWLERLSSQGRVAVNGKVVEKRALRDGDVLTIGTQDLTFHRK